MDKRPVIIIIFLLLFIFGIVALIGINWFTNTFQPALETKQVIQATQEFYASKTAQEATQFFNATKTMETGNLFASQTAQALIIMQTETAMAKTAAYNAEMTQTAIPTSTPEILVTCIARVINDNSALNPVPSRSNYPAKVIFINEQDKVTVNSLVKGSNWVHVSYQEHTGFMNRSNLLIDADCQPNVYDLHFLAGWLKPNWKVLVEDTFTTNEHVWLLQESGEQLVPQMHPQHSFLQVNAEKGLQTFTTEALHNIDFPSIKLHVNLMAYPALPDGYFAFRFYPNAESYTELRFIPKACAYEVFRNDVLSYEAKVISSVCIDLYYDLVVTLNANGTMYFVVNGEEYGPMDIPGIKNPRSISDIYFSVSKINAGIDYIFISVPR